MASQENEDLRIGVVVCECGLNISKTVDCSAVAECAKGLDDVVFTTVTRFACSDPGQKEIQQAIKEHNLNRVVIASCTPKIHEPTFRHCVEEAGLNKYLMEMANIREHCSWVHQREPEAATQKAKDLVKSAVFRARFLEPREEPVMPVEKAALVVGGGIAGIQSALDLADGGHQVYLVEKQPTIGGIMAKLYKTYPTMDCAI